MTNANVNHDDTAAFTTALATGGNIWVLPGQYNVTSALTIAYPQWVQCSGAGVGLTAGFSGNASPLGGTVFFNRGKTNNVINITSQQAHLMDCGIVQAADITPSAGYALVMESGSSTLLDGGWVERNFVYNTYGLWDVNQGVIAWDISNNTFYGGPLTAVMAVYNNPEPAGDNRMFGNTIVNQVSESLPGLSFVAGDTNEWTNLDEIPATPASH